MKRLRSILLFNQTKNETTLFYLLNAEQDEFIIKNWNETALF
jgi:hypothetical protein